MSTASSEAQPSRAYWLYLIPGFVGFVTIILIPFLS